MKVFDFDDYKKFVTATIKASPGGGRGSFQKMAAHLKVHSTMMSQIFRGTKDLTLEQACGLAEYFGLGELETEYFVGLVEIERAGSHKLKALVSKRVAQLRQRGQSIGRVLQTEQTLDERAKVIYFSNWYYAGIYFLTELEGFDSIDAIAKRFGLRSHIVERVVEFLVEHGFCRIEKGKVRHVPGRDPHLGTGTNLIFTNLSAWRLKAIEHFPQLVQGEVELSYNLNVSEEQAARIHRKIVELTEAVKKIEKDSPAAPERFMCLNVDWFGL